MLQFYIYTFRLCEVGSLEEPRDQTNVYQTGQVGIRHYPLTLLECKTEEHRQPMERTRGLFCMFDSGVARCESQHQCDFWRMSSMF